MLTLYTAIGRLKIKRDEMGHPVPVVINNRQEYGLSEHELVLWSCLAFQILQIYELERAYASRLEDSGCRTANWGRHKERIIFPDFF